jgi:hypothetical protein
LDEFWLAALPPSREGTSWLNILKTLVGYQLISPGTGKWRGFCFLKPKKKSLFYPNDSCSR